MVVKMYVYLHIHPSSVLEVSSHGCADGKSKTLCWWCWDAIGRL